VQLLLNQEQESPIQRYGRQSQQDEELDPLLRKPKQNLIQSKEAKQIKMTLKMCNGPVIPLRQHQIHKLLPMEMNRNTVFATNKLRSGWLHARVDWGRNI